MSKTTNTKHLWEVEHPYYCNLGNYFSNDCGMVFESWAAFLDEFGDADFDMNLLFRWDWRSIDTDREGNPRWSKSDDYRDGQLEIFWMGQRKGIYQYSVVKVCRNDEAAVIEYLKPRLEHLKALWTPLQ